MNVVDNPKSLAKRLATTMAMLMTLTPRGGDAQTEQRAQGKRWNFSITFQETGGGLGFAPVTSGDSVDFDSMITDSLSTRASFANLSERSQLRLEGWVSANSRNREYDSMWPSYGGSFSWSYQGARFGANFTQAGVSGLDSGTLAAVGVLPTRLDSWRFETSSNISYRFSPRMSISVGFDYDRTGFKNPEALDSSLIVLENPPFENDLSNVVPEPQEEQQEDLPKPPDAQAFILDVIASEGLSNPNLSSEAVGASIGLLHRISRRTRLSMNFYGGYRNFTATGPATRLTNGINYGAAASLSRMLTPRDSFFLMYRLRQNSAQLPVVVQHTLTAGWGRTIRRRLPTLDFQAQGGVGTLRASEVSFDDVAPVADVGLSAELTRSTNLGFRFRSGHNETRGFGRNLRTNFLIASFSQSFTSRARLSLNAGYTIGNDLIAQNLGSEGGRYGAQFYFSITEDFRFEATYQRVGRQPRGQQAVRTSNDLWTIVVSYRRAWPRLR